MFDRTCHCGAQIQAKTEDQLDAAMKEHEEDVHGKPRRGRPKKDDDDE